MQQGCRSLFWGYEHAPQAQSKARLPLTAGLGTCLSGQRCSKATAVCQAGSLPLRLNSGGEFAQCTYMSCCWTAR